VGRGYQSSTLSQFLGQLERLDAARALMPALDVHFLSSLPVADLALQSPLPEGEGKGEGPSPVVQTPSPRPSPSGRGSKKVRHAPVSRRNNTGARLTKWTSSLTMSH
jgi:hypothetical protein